MKKILNLVKNIFEFVSLLIKNDSLIEIEYEYRETQKNNLFLNLTFYEIKKELEKIEKNKQNKIKFIRLILIAKHE